MHIPENWDEREQKGAVRSYALDNLQESRSSLWLPSSKAECLKRAAKQGIVTSDTQITCVERDDDIYKKMEKEVIQLLDWERQPLLFHGDLVNLKPKRKFDFCFIDFLGSFESYDILKWMQSVLSPKLKQSSTVCFTLTYSWRNNQCMYNLSEAVQQLDGYKVLSDELKLYDEYLLVPIVLFKIVFEQWRFDIRWPVKYQDSQRPMILYRLDNFQNSKHESGWPCLESLIPKGERKMPAKTKKGRKQAAQKAWETRRQEPIEFITVVEAILEQKRGHKQLLQRYVDQQVKLNGSEPNRIEAAVKAYVTRRQQAAA